MTQRISEHPASETTKTGRGKRSGNSDSKPSVDPPRNGENRRAIDATLAELERMGRLEKVDTAKVQMVRSMADALDAKPWNSQMWKEYRETIEGLVARGDDDADIQSILAELQAPVRNPEKG